MIVDKLKTDTLTDFEKLALYIIENACLKLVAAVDLLKTRYSHPAAYFLTVIAEEELAKLIMLPIAKELDELNKLLDQKNRGKSIYYNHTIKQKIFTSYGLQNRNYKSLQKLKEKCIYVDINNESKPCTVYISIKEVFDEVVLACILFTDFIDKLIRGSKSVSYNSDADEHFSDTFREIAKYMLVVLRESIEHKLPQLRKRILKKLQERDRQMKEKIQKAKSPKVECLPIVLSNPYALIDFFRALYGEKTYKYHLSQIIDKDYAAISDYIVKSYVQIWGSNE